MSLIIKTEPTLISSISAQDLEAGMWFADKDDQVFVVIYDDRLQERRVLSLGHYYKPFLLNAELQDLEVERILARGTTFELGFCHQEGGAS